MDPERISKITRGALRRWVAQPRIYARIRVLKGARDPWQVWVEPEEKQRLSLPAPKNKHGTQNTTHKTH